MKTKQTGKLDEHVEIAIGMRGMVLMNLSTEGDLANGTRGEIVEIKFNMHEPLPLEEDAVTGSIRLKFPPAVVFFKPDKCSFPRFHGLPDGVIPIVPSKRPFSIKSESGGTITINRRQMAMTAGYAFTGSDNQVCVGGFRATADGESDAFQHIHDTFARPRKAIYTTSPRIRSGAVHDTSIAAVGEGG
ncbi:hypothetical protein DFH09DRAFT_1444451 [Mycena vulgaris]|nr:hypothetical protein DFH09DRAFT_1444451 [Mycena vulgaris]